MANKLNAAETSSGCCCASATTTAAQDTHSDRELPLGLSPAQPPRLTPSKPTNRHRP